MSNELIKFINEMTAISVGGGKVVTVDEIKDWLQYDINMLEQDMDKYFPVEDRDDSDPEWVSVRDQHLALSAILNKICVVERSRHALHEVPKN